MDKLPLVDCIIEDDRWEAFGLEALALRAVGAVFSEIWGCARQGSLAVSDGL